MKSLFLFADLRNYQDILLNRDKNKKYFLFRKKKWIGKILFCS